MIVLDETACYTNVLANVLAGSTSLVQVWHNIFG